jgi:hypothetical protein
VINTVDIIDSLVLTGFLLVLSIVLFIFGYLFSLILAIISKTEPRRKTILYKALLAGIPFGFVGIVSGFMTGSSRSDSVSALTPAILTFVGLFAVYFIGKNWLKNIVASFSVFIFSANLLVGIFLGTSSRERYAESISSVQRQKQLAEEEFAIRRYRVNLGLPPVPPKPARDNDEVQTEATNNGK